MARLYGDELLADVTFVVQREEVSPGGFISALVSSWGNDMSVHMVLANNTHTTSQVMVFLSWYHSATAITGSVFAT